MFSRFARVRFFSTALHAETRECFIKPLEGSHKGISVLTLNRPQAKNALGRTLLAQFQECLESLHVAALSGDCRVVVVKSSVDGVFCAGADLKERSGMSESEASAFVSKLRSTFTQLENIPVPTIAAVDGAALGGGLELALCCDLRVAGSKAILGLPETKLAIIPGAGGTQRLPRLIGTAKAKELIFTARRLTPSQAQQYGIVNETAERAEERALDLAAEILPQGPVALRMAKLAIDRGSPLDINSGLAVEQLCYAQVLSTQDRLEGLAAFKDKRMPKYTGK